jgi:nicotinamidase-related amidase
LEGIAVVKRRVFFLSIFFSFAFGAGIGALLVGNENFNNFVRPSSDYVASGYTELPRIKKSLEKLYDIETTSRSYFKKDVSGVLVPENGKKLGYYKVSEGVYSFTRSISNTKSALIVMDPRADSGSNFLTSYYEKTFQTSLLPLVKKAIALGIPVLILTNSPDIDIAYSSKIHPELEKLSDQGLVEIIFHQSTNSELFSQWLRGMSIDTLIYSGFASNMCLIGRDLGMIPMQIKGFRLFFVPEASAAVEFDDSWKDGGIHKSTTLLISQWVGEIIRLRDFTNL